MKTAFRILGFLAVVVALGVGILSIFYMGYESSSVTADAFRLFLCGLLVCGLVFAVLLFFPNLQLGKILLWSTVIILIAAIFASPDTASTWLNGYENRALALLTGIPVLATGLCADGIARIATSKNARNNSSHTINQFFNPNKNLYTGN